MTDATCEAREQVVTAAAGGRNYRLVRRDRRASRSFACTFFESGRGGCERSDPPWIG